MTKEIRNRTDVCFDAFQSMNLDGLEDQWLLLIGGKRVFSHPSEEVVLQYARDHYPDVVPCLLKVPIRHPYSM